MLSDRTIASNDALSSGRTASQERSVASSIAQRVGIVGPIAVAAVGVVLRLEAFLRNYALTLDEAALARNIIERPWTKLLGWLDYAQLAPPGFLVAEKAVTTLLGTSEYALRLFPVTCGLLALWLCWKVCRRLLLDVPAFLAFSLFALNTSMIDYATRAKPYAGDMAATLLVIFLATRLFEPNVTRAKSAWLAIAGGLTCLFSFAAVFVLAAVALVSLNRARRDLQRRPSLVIAGAIWMVSAGVGALIATISLSPADAAYMQWFWQPAFMPVPPRSAEQFWWLGHELKAIVRWALDYRGSVIWLGAAAVGIWSLWKRRQSDAALLLTLPLILVIVASALHKYPFTSGRITLFLLPPLLMLVAEGADWWRRTFTTPQWIAIAPMVLFAALGLQGSWSGWRIQRNGDLRSVFGYVKAHWQPGDRLFVHYTAGQNFFYYAPRFGFKPDDYMVGDCSDDVRRTALWEVERYRGRSRVWVAVWATDQTELLFQYLSATATIRDAFSNDSHGLTDISMMRGAAILYDLSGPASVDAAGGKPVTPATFTPPAGFDPVENPQACYGVFHAIGDNGSAK